MESMYNCIIFRCVRYMPECEFCKVKEICGGFFASTKQLMKPEVWPIGQDDES